MRVGLMRRRIIVPVLLLLLCWSVSQALAAAELRGRVSWVYDGDTIRVAGIGKVRMLGIDVPEKEASRRDRFFLRRGIAQARLRNIHNRANVFVREQILGRSVSLRTEKPAYDAYGRLLAYVTLPDGRLLNRLLLKQGLAVVYRRFDFDLKKDFLAAEQEARRARRGMWVTGD